MTVQENQSKNINKIYVIFHLIRAIEEVIMHVKENIPILLSLEKLNNRFLNILWSKRKPEGKL